MVNDKKLPHYSTDKLMTLRGVLVIMNKLYEECQHFQALRQLLDI